VVLWERVWALRGPTPIRRLISKIPRTPFGCVVRSQVELRNVEDKAYSGAVQAGVVVNLGEVTSRVKTMKKSVKVRQPMEGRLGFKVINIS